MWKENNSTENKLKRDSGLKWYTSGCLLDLAFVKCFLALALRDYSLSIAVCSSLLSLLSDFQYSTHVSLTNCFTIPPIFFINPESFSSILFMGTVNCWFDVVSSESIWKKEEKHRKNKTKLMAQISPIYFIISKWGKTMK